MKTALKVLTACVLTFVALCSAMAQTVSQQWTPFTVVGAPALVVFGTATKTVAVVKAPGTYNCAAASFPSDPDPAAWKTCTVYPIQTTAACVPKWAGGTGVGARIGASLGLEASAWLSYWCPGPVPVVLACRGLGTCMAVLTAFAEGSKGFAEAAAASTTAPVTDSALLDVWAGSADRIAKGRP